VRVAVRVRPFIEREMKESGGPRSCVNVQDAENKLLMGEKQYQFDRVFSTDAEQQEIFDVCARNLVLGCFVGYNATILAYG
jgi:Kinesin motor domain